MTMIDEEVLTRALHDAADRVDVSEDAVKHILAEAQVDPATRSRRVREYFAERPRGRTVLVAAACLVVVGAIALPLLRSEVVGRPRPTPASTAAPAPPLGTVGLSVSPNGVAPNGTAISTPASGKSLHATSSTAPAIATSQKIESTGTVNLTVHRNGVAGAITKLTELATSDGGFVDSTEARVGTQTLSSFANATVVLQVPQRRFTSLVGQVQLLGRATRIITSSSNVTGQYVNLQARISELEVSLAQYERIMARATTIGGILAVQAQIDALQSQIEQYQGALKVLGNETTFGALTVNIAQPHLHVVPLRRRTGFDKAWHDSVSGFVAGFEWLVRLAGPTLFAVLLLAALWLLGRYSRRALLRRRI